MKPVVRIFVICLATFVLLIGAVVGVGIYKPKSYEGLYNWVLYKNSGYRFTIEDLSIQYSPTKIFITGLELNNPEWEASPQLLRLGNAELTIQLGNYFRNELPYWSAVFNDLDIFVTEDEQGNSNWITSIIASKETESDEPLQIEKLFSFSKVNFKNSKINHAQGELTKDFELSSLSLSRTDQPSVQIQGMGLYEMEQVEIDGEVSIDSNDPSGQTLQFALQAKGLDIDLQANGKINPQNSDGSGAHISAASESLDELEEVLKEKIPDVEPITVSLDLTSSKDTYEASKIQIQFGENSIAGDILYNSKENLVHVNLIADTLDFSPYITGDDESPENLAQTADAHKAELSDSQIENTAGESELDWTWEKIGFDANLQVGKIIANQHVINDFSASLGREDKDIKIDHIRGKYEQINKDKTEQNFSTDLLEISGIVQPLGLAMTTQVQDILLSLLISEGDSKIVIDGPVNLNGVEGTKLKIDAKAAKLDSLTQYLQKDFSLYLPASVSVDIETVAHGLKLDNLVAQSKESDLSGNANVDWSKDIVKIEGTFNSKVIDIAPSLEKQNNDKETPKQEQEIKQDGGKVFTEAEIDWSWLETFDVDAEINVDEFRAPSKVFAGGEAENIYSNVYIKIDLTDGTLNVNPVQANLADGKINSVLKISKIKDGADIEFKADALNMSLDSLGASGDSVVKGGVTDIVIDLTGHGISAHQIASSLNGEFVIDMQESIVENTLFELIGTDLFFKLISTISPFVKETKTTELECLAIKFVAEDGVLTSQKQMAFESTRMKVVGSGKIDMHTENIAIGFTPIAKKGIGVNVSNVVKFVYLGGTLSNPKMENDPVGIAKSGVAVSTAFATGGLSLIVEGLFKRVTSAGDICKRALEDSSKEPEENIPSNTRDVTDQPEGLTNATQ